MSLGDRDTEAKREEHRDPAYEKAMAAGLVYHYGMGEWHVWLEVGEVVQESGGCGFTPDQAANFGFSLKVLAREAEERNRPGEGP